MAAKIQKTGRYKWFEIFVNDKLWAGFKMLDWAEKVAALLKKRK